MLEFLINTVNEYDVKELLLFKIRRVDDAVRSGNLSFAYIELLSAIGQIERYRSALELAKKILEELMLS
jgi:hypothetical protein